MAAAPVSGRLPKGHILLNLVLGISSVFRKDSTFFQKFASGTVETVCPSCTVRSHFPNRFNVGSCWYESEAGQMRFGYESLWSFVSYAWNDMLCGSVREPNPSVTAAAFCLSYWMIVCAFSCWATQRLSSVCVCSPSCTCVSVHVHAFLCAWLVTSLLSACALPLVGSGAVRLQWWTRRPRLTDWETEMMWWKLALTTFVSLPTPSLHDRVW